jgi:hypothetical protein
MTKSPSGWIRVGKSLAGGENASLRSAGDLPRTETKTMKNGNLLAVQEAMVRRIVSELNRFDNVYYESFSSVVSRWTGSITLPRRL